MRDEYLRCAQVILRGLVEEKIQTPESSGFNDITRVALNTFREMTIELSRIYPGPGMTGCVAITLLHVAACQELVQRFALEYILLSKQSNVSLVFLGDPETLVHGGDNHVFALIGTVKAPDEIFVGRGARGVKITDCKNFIPLSDFLKQQDLESVVVDPLLNFAESVQDPCTALIDYCARHKITHVSAIKAYNTTVGIVEMAGELKDNARRLAETIKMGIPISLREFFLKNDKKLEPLEKVVEKMPIVAKPTVTASKPDMTVPVTPVPNSKVSFGGFKAGFLNRPSISAKSTSDIPKCEIKPSFCGS